MKLFRYLLILTAMFTFVTACNKTTYRKTAGGMPYRIIRGNDTTKVASRAILKLSFTQKVNDSVYFTNVGKPPFYTPVPQDAMPYDLSEVWQHVFIGDSIITVQAMDTFMKRNPGQIAPHFKKGDRIVTYVKVLGAFANAADAVNDEKLEKEKFQQKEINELTQYLKEKNIETVRTKSGAFLRVDDQGTGPAVDSGKFVMVNYTGTSYSGKKFDSNTDTAFHHVEPYGYTAGAGEMIPGFDEGVMLLNKGGKGKIYVPSMLGYGAGGRQPMIQPYEHLIFDIEVVDVMDSRPVQPDPRTLQNPGSNAPGNN